MMSIAPQNIPNQPFFVNWRYTAGQGLLVLRRRHRERSPRSVAIWWGRGSGPTSPDCFAEPRNDRCAAMARLSLWRISSQPLSLSKGQPQPVPPWS
jgi:hypothetical protein